MIMNKMKSFSIILLIVLHNAIIGYAVLSPHSPEPLSDDFDIDNLMFVPPDHPISPQRDNNDATVHQPQKEQAESNIKGKQLAKHYKAKWMREYRIRKKSDSAKQQTKSIREKIIENEGKIVLPYVQRRRELQKESYKRLKEKRGYGKLHQITFKNLRQKVKDGIPMTPDENEKYQKMYDSQQKSYKKKMSEKRNKQT